MNQGHTANTVCDSTDSASTVKARNVVEEAVLSRRSVRAFKDQPVPLETVSHILKVAQRAASGTNIQPWKVHVLVGQKKRDLTARIHEIYWDDDIQRNDPPTLEYDYYPKKWREPYLSRRKAVGWGLYSLLGIGRRDLGKMREQQARNYQFFDAPVGFIFTIDRDFEKGSWLDYGIFLGNIMTVARGLGLHTCAQAAFSNYHAIVKEVLDIPVTETVIAGMALGYEDTTAPENSLRTDRAALEEFVTFHTE